MLKKSEKNPATEIRPARMIMPALFLAAIVSALLFSVSAYAGVGTDRKQSGVGDITAPVTQFWAPPAVSLQKLSSSGVRLELSSNERVKGTIYLHIPVVTVSGEAGSVSPLAVRRIRLKSGKRRVRIRIPKSKRKLLRHKRKLMVVFVAQDRSGNRSAPLVKYLRIKKK